MAVRQLAENLRFVYEAGFVIGSGGLKKAGGEKLTLQTNTIYYLGASSSPSAVIVTGVSDKKVEYQSYPFHKGGKSQGMETWIFRDLAATGITTWLKSGYAKHNPEMAKNLQALLDGKKAKANAEDIRPWKVIVKGTARQAVSDEPEVATGKADDEWYAAEQYGSVAGLSKGQYEILTDKKRLAELEKDKTFEIVSKEEL